MTSKQLRAYASELRETYEMMSEIAELLDAIQEARRATGRRRPTSDRRGAPRGLRDTQP